MSQRSVELVVERVAKHKLKITGPKTAGIMPPGPACTLLLAPLVRAPLVRASLTRSSLDRIRAGLFVLGDGVPSAGKKVMVGNGASESPQSFALTPR